MEKKIIILIICFLTFNFLKGQPLDTPSVSIEEIYLRNKQIYFKAINSETYISVSKNDNFPIDKNDNSTYIFVNSDSFYIKDKDTMQIKLIFQKHFPIAPIILKMTFQKGIYIIDMNKCVKDKGFIIKDFPCDCIAYRKEEEEISSK